MKILATAPIPSVAIDALAQLGSVTVCSNSLADEIEGADILLARAEEITGEHLRRADRLRVIARTGAGVDNVDIAAATAKGIPVVNAPAVGARPVAEGTWALILAAAKRLGEHRACMEEGRWNERYTLEGLDLDGATLGVVGLGAIGREVARIGRAFGTKVLGVDPADGGDASLLAGIERTDLKDLIRRSDIVTLHCNLNASTRGLISGELLRSAERRPILVNAARGAVVDGDDLLLEALDYGWVSAVGLDVYSSEPLDPGSRLLRDPRVICTPHSIGLTRRWNENVFASLARDIDALLEGRRPERIVNPQVLKHS